MTSLNRLKYDSLLSILATLFLSSALTGKPVSSFEGRSYTDASYPSNVMAYRLFVPEHYDPSRSYPMIINLHGLGNAGGADQQMLDQGGGAMYFANDAFQAREPTIVVIPQEPSGTTAHWHNSPTRHILTGLLDSLENEFNIDEDRIYVGGISMGGKGTWRTLYYSPNRFAAAFPVASFNGSGDAPTISHIPVWATHASDDSVVGVSGSRNMVNAMRNAGASTIYTETDSGGHVLGVYANTQPGFTDWLLRQRRGRVATGNTLLDVTEVVKADTASLSGTAKNNGFGVSRVEWQNSQGGSGTAAGTETWSISGIALQNGTNQIRVTGYGPTTPGGYTGETSFNQVITINHSAPVGDTTAPSLALTSPSVVDDRYETTSSSLLLAGTASDNVGVSSVSVTIDSGPDPDVTGTLNWSSTVPLEVGDNMITIRATDSQGNFSQKVFRAYRQSTVNLPPHVLAGPDAQILAPQNTLQMESHVGDDQLPQTATLQWSQVSGPSAVMFDDATALRPEATFPQVGDYVLKLTADDGEYQVSDQVNVRVRVVTGYDPASAVYAINLDGPAYTDADGVVYEDGRDSPYILGGAHANYSQSIDETVDDALYQTGFWSRSTFECYFPIPNGDYIVTLKMMDISNTAGSSLRDIFIEGYRVLEKYDVLAHTVKFTAHDIDVPVTITDGELTLYHEDFGARSILNALVVRSAYAMPANTAPTVDAGSALEVAINNSAQPAPSIVDDGVLPGRLFPELQWTQISGPGNAYFTDDSAQSPMITFSETGVYVLSLEVDDGEFTGSDTVTVTVTDPVATQVRIDFGSGSTAPNGWNVASSHSGASGSNLVDENGAVTSIDFDLTSGFLNKDQTGRTDSILYQADAVGDGFYTNLHRVAEVTFSDLDPSKEYDVTIYASTTADADAEGVYSADGVTVHLQAYNNTSETITLTNLTPNSSGELALTASAKDQTGRVVISVLSIGESPEGNPMPGYAAWVRSRYPDAYETESVGGVDADPAGLGMTNFEAYAFGLDSAQNPASGIPSIYAVNDGIDVTFHWRAEPDVAYTAFVTDDLSDANSWVPVANYHPTDGTWSGSAVVEVEGNHPRTGTIRNLSELIDGETSGFLRLEANSVVSP